MCSKLIYDFALISILIYNYKRLFETFNCIISWKGNQKCLHLIKFKGNLRGTSEGPKVKVEDLNETSFTLEPILNENGNRIIVLLVFPCLHNSIGYYLCMCKFQAFQFLIFFCQLKAIRQFAFVDSNICRSPI